MFIHLRNLILLIFLLALSGCGCNPKMECGQCDQCGPRGCPFDPCARLCPPPRDCSPTVAELTQLERKCTGWSTYSSVFELRKRGVQVIEIGENVIILLPVDRFFEVNCATIRECAYVTLNHLVCFLNSYGCVPLYISGHTDNVASQGFNLRLSDARAQSIQAYLWVRGIQFRRMCATGCGNCAPIANQVTVAGNEANRRIEIRIRRTGCL